jgi:hypothetical protein
MLPLLPWTLYPPAPPVLESLQANVRSKSHITRGWFVGDTVFESSKVGGGEHLVQLNYTAGYLHGD